MNLAPRAANGLFLVVLVGVVDLIAGTPQFDGGLRRDKSGSPDVSVGNSPR
jgi:hypothetical protein